MRQRRVFFRDAIQRQGDRLGEAVNWFPYPALITFLLVLIFTEVTSLGLNPRLGNLSDILEMDAPEESAGAIWLAVSPLADRIVITTGDRKVFSWPLRPKEEDLQPFQEYLRQRIQDGILTSSLGGTATANQASVVFACDVRLTYAHFRPILSSLAEVGISNFSFESRLPAEIGGASRTTLDRAL